MIFDNMNSIPLYPGTSKEAYIQAMYDKDDQALRAKLEEAYNRRIDALVAERQTVAPTYQAAAGQAAAQSELNRAAFQEQAAASGLNSGAAGQAALARQNALQSSVGAIRRDEANAYKDLDQQKLRLGIEYEENIRQAIRQNDLARAKALYEEQVRMEEAMREALYQQMEYAYKIWAQKQK